MRNNNSLKIARKTTHVDAATRPPPPQHVDAQPLIRGLPIHVASPLSRVDDAAATQKHAKKAPGTAQSMSAHPIITDQTGGSASSSPSPLLQQPRPPTQQQQLKEAQQPKQPQQPRRPKKVREPQQEDHVKSTTESKQRSGKQPKKPKQQPQPSRSVAELKSPTSFPALQRTPEPLLSFPLVQPSVSPVIASIAPVNMAAVEQARAPVKVVIAQRPAPAQLKPDVKEPRQAKQPRQAQAPKQVHVKQLKKKSEPVVKAVVASAPVDAAQASRDSLAASQLSDALQYLARLETTAPADETPQACIEREAGTITAQMKGVPQVSRTCLAV